MKNLINCSFFIVITFQNKKDGYRQWNVRQFQSAISLKHNLAIPQESHAAVCCSLHPFCGWRHLAIAREFEAHFGLPGYAPGTIAVNVT